MKASPDYSRLVNHIKELRKAWWVFLVTLIYMGIANKLLGTGCIFTSMTGIPCPGCGITRSILALLRLDFIASLQYYPMLIPCGAGFTAYFIFWMRKGTGTKGWNRFLEGMGIAIVVVYVVRMFFLFPDTPPLNFNHRAMLPRVIDWIREGIP
jgi:hypothetical protein